MSDRSGDPLYLAYVELTTNRFAETAEAAGLGARGTILEIYTNPNNGEDTSMRSTSRARAMARIRRA
ncbi:hypothetical protein [Gordonia sp. CPCC 205333]|uniref:hypothetical protein n=1 Tax=Gordonia sp. CPCC 205333 TaxID=3140790 RepID=UPI003AF38EB0